MIAVALARPMPGNSCSKDWGAVLILIGKITADVAFGVSFIPGLLAVSPINGTIISSPSSNKAARFMALLLAASENPPANWTASLILLDLGRVKTPALFTAPVIYTVIVDDVGGIDSCS